MTGASLMILKSLVLSFLRLICTQHAPCAMLQTTGFAPSRKWQAVSFFSNWQYIWRQ